MFKAIEVLSKEDFLDKVENELKFEKEVTVQEKVKFNGPEDEIPVYLYCDEKSEVKVISSAVKTMIYPYPYGTAVELELIKAVDSELIEISRSVCKAIKWHGFLMIEFIKDLKDGQWKIIELNFRPWLFIDFFRRSGLNYLSYFYEELFRNIVPSVQVSSSQKSNFHISLSGALEAISLSGTIVDYNFIEEWLGELEKNYNISFTYLDPEDPEPFLSELAEVCKAYSLSLDPIYNLVSTYNGY